MRLLRILFFVALAMRFAMSHALADVSYSFDANDGGFTVENVGAVEDPWVYDSGRGTWSVGGSTNVGMPTSSGLRTNTYQLDAAGSISLSFDHRYSIEWDGTTRWDGAALMYRVNDGGFHYVDGSQFVSEGYVAVIAGNNALYGLEGFSDLSAGYFGDDYITSVVQLGNFNAGDKVQVEFLGAWDEYARGNPDGTVPNWEIDSISVIGQLTVVPDLPPPPLFVGGEGTIGQDFFQSSQSNRVFGAPQEGFSGRIVTYEEHGTTLDSHTIAEDVLADFEGVTATGTYSVVDLAGGGGTFGENHPYPNGVNNDSQSDFAVQVTADVVIPAGTWTIGFGSDDGGRVKIPGVEFIDSLNNDMWDDDELRYEIPRAHGWTVGTFELDEPLETTIIGEFYERGGGDSFEIAVIDEYAIENANPNLGWELLGDGVFDWSVTAKPLVSADLSAEVSTSRGVRFDVNGDTGEADQIIVDNPDPSVFTTILDVDGATFQIDATGTFTNGQAFRIVDADTILGTPILAPRNPEQTWSFDPGTGLLTFVGGTLLGDYNENGELDAEDLDWQAEVALGLRPFEEKYDQNGDGVVDQADRTIWLTDLFETWSGGDSNLDKEFNTADFVQVFTEGKYETGQRAGYAQGDWTGDLLFDTADFVYAFTVDAYEKGPFTGDGVAAVPEPASVVLLLLGLFGCLHFVRRR